MNKTIYLVRHGETDYNKRKIIQGSGVDASLNETGRAQAQALFKQYGQLQFDIVLTSALIRTHQTMEPFIKGGLPWEQHPTINEMNWGEHEGKVGTPEMRAKYQEMLMEWAKLNFHAKLAGGESAYELGARVSSFINHIKSRKEQQILVCSHGRAMRCIVCLMKGQSLTEMEQYKHSNTGLYIIRYEEEVFHFDLENDISHLKDLI